MRGRIAVLLTAVVLTVALGSCSRKEEELTVVQIEVGTVSNNDGSLWAWSNNRWGYLGAGITENSYNPMQIMEYVLAVSAGDLHTVVLKGDRSVWAWGNNANGQLGDGTTEDRHSPVQIIFE